MKLFSEWLQEAAGIATSRAQCVQGDEPSFAGACSNLPSRKGKRKKESTAPGKLKKMKNEAGIVGEPVNTKDFFTAGAGGKQEKSKAKKSKPKMD